MAKTKKVLPAGAKADGEHMMCPHAETDEADRDRGRHHRRITKDRLAREDGDDLVDERERRQHQDVDLRVTEDPEEVHPQNGRAAGLGIEEVRAEIAVEQSA